MSDAPHLFRMACVVKQDKASHPADLGLFRADAEVCEAQDLAHLIEQRGFVLPTSPHDVSSDGT